MKARDLPDVAALIARYKKLVAEQDALLAEKVTITVTFQTEGHEVRFVPTEAADPRDADTIRTRYQAVKQAQVDAVVAQLAALGVTDLKDE